MLVSAESVPYKWGDIFMAAPNIASFLVQFDAERLNELLASTDLLKKKLLPPPYRALFLKKLQLINLMEFCTFSFGLIKNPALIPPPKPVLAVQQILSYKK